MDQLTKDYPSYLLAEHPPPCLSLYQPTHRRHPENLQDPIRFRNLLENMEESLCSKYASSDISDLLQPFHALADDQDFWNHTADGLVVLGAKNFFRIYRLQRAVVERSIVANSFYTEPLLRIAQSADCCRILRTRATRYGFFAQSIGR